jgi:hypothetical protein
MIQAKRVLRAEDAANPNIAAITQALNEYEDTIKTAEQASGTGGAPKIGSYFCEVVPGHGEATDAPHPRQGAVQFRRQDDAQQRRQRLDGRGFSAAATARLQPAGRELQPRRQYLTLSQYFSALATPRLRSIHPLPI